MDRKSPACFKKPDDTGIPALQDWCHDLTWEARQSTAESVMKSLQILLETFATYLRSMLDSYDLNRVVLRDRWQTQGHDQLKERDDDVAQFSLAQGNDDETASLELIRPTLTMADVGVEEGSRAGLSSQLKSVRNSTVWVTD